eukprot:scaffold539_cov187-Ochromonas_danica.AAC.14
MVGSASQVIRLADTINVLTCEAMGAPLDAFDSSLFETFRQHRGQMQSASNLKALLEGSKRVTSSFNSMNKEAWVIVDIPQTTGPAIDIFAMASRVMDIELNSSEIFPLSIERGMVLTDSQAVAYLNNAMAVVEQVIQASQVRCRLLSTTFNLPSSDYIVYSSDSQPQALLQTVRLVEQLAGETILALRALQQIEDASQETVKEKEKEKEREQGGGKAGGNKPESDDSHLTPEQRAKAEAKRKAKAEKAAAKAAAKEQRKASSIVLGNGSAAVRSLLLSLLSEGSSSPEELPVATLVGRLAPTILPVSTWQRVTATSTEIKPRHLLEELQTLLESLHAGGKRKPKIAKGARDFTPEQMRIREQAFNTIRSVFKRHGGVEIDTPVFELKEVLTGKYGEDSKLIYDLADQGGELLSLRYDLTVPFARFLAMNSVGNIKRYHMAKVYRRDNPQLSKGRYREFYQCDFDVAGQYNLMVPDAEVITIATEILSALPIGPFMIKLNHRKLLDAIFDMAGVPSSKFRAICSSVDKLDKMTWEEVKHEMIHEKDLPEEIADKIGTFVLYSGTPLVLWKQLTDLALFSGHAVAQSAMDELKVLFTYLEAMGSLNYISFDLSLARGLDYYTGVIYEAVLVSNGGEGGGAIQMGSIAAGGRYDNLVGMFSPSNTQTPCVGISIGVERVFTIMERRAEQLKLAQRVDIQVYIASIGADLLVHRMQVARLLWQAQISAEYSHLDNPKFKKQLDEALERGIPFMVVFGGDEVEAGQVKVKDMVKKEEVVLPREELVAELVRRGCKVISPGDDSFIQAMKQADSLPTPPANVEEGSA